MTANPGTCLYVAGGGVSISTLSIHSSAPLSKIIPRLDFRFTDICTSSRPGCLALFVVPTPKGPLLPVDTK